MKKFIAVFILILMTLSFISCGTTEVIDDEDIKTNIEDMYNSDGTVKLISDTNGYEFKLFARRHGANPAELWPEVGAYDRGDKLLLRYKETETAFNCTVLVEEKNVEVVNIQKDVSAGLKCADLIDTDALILSRSAEMLLVALDDIDYDIDLESGKWGSKSQLEVVNIRGLQYGFRSAYWSLPWPSAKGVLYFRPNVLREAQLANPFELYEKRDWTWKQFEVMLSALTFKGETKNDDHYGMCAPTAAILPEVAVLANGGRSVYLDEKDGLYKFGMNDPKVLEALEWVRKLIREDESIKYIADWSTVGHRGFINGLYGFHLEQGWKGFQTGPDNFPMEILEEYAWCSFPIGPNGSYDTVSAVATSENRYFCIPISPDQEYELTLQIIDFMFNPLPGENKDSWQEELYRNYFWDGYDGQQSFKHYLNMVTNARLDYSTTIEQALRSDSKGILSVYQKTINSTKSITEAIAAVQSFVETEINTKLNHIEE